MTTIAGGLFEYVFAHRFESFNRFVAFAASSALRSFIVAVQPAQCNCRIIALMLEHLILYKFRKGFFPYIYCRIFWEPQHHCLFVCFLVLCIANARLALSSEQFTSLGHKAVACAVG